MTEEINLVEKMNRELKIGDLVEVVLFESAEFYDGGDNPSGYTTIPGYTQSKNKIQDEGVRFAGYVKEFESHSVILQMGMDIDRNKRVEGNRSLYFHNDAIHSYQKLSKL